MRTATDRIIQSNRAQHEGTEAALERSGEIYRNIVLCLCKTAP